jgi:hypothetical protein
VKKPNCGEAVSKEANGWVQGASDGGTRRVSERGVGYGCTYRRWVQGVKKRGRGAGQQGRHKSVQVEFFLCRFFREIYPLIERPRTR